MTTALATTEHADIMERVIIEGDLSRLTAQERVAYYRAVCESVGLNPLTRPFDYINLQGKLTLYARKDATDQLRRIHSVSIAIVDRERIEDVYVITARATTSNRADESTGAVNIAGLKGDALANALMKAECVPLDSEILTRDGFKRYDQVSIGDEVLAYDCETDTCRWTPLENVTVYEDAPVIQMYTAGGQFSVTCTPDHSWAVVNPPYKPRGLLSRVRGPYKNRRNDQMLVKAQKINKGQKIVIAAQEAFSLNPGLLSPVEAAILGWAVTDGTIQERGRIGICQSKEKNFAIIRETVAAMTDRASEVVSKPRTRTFPSSGRTYDTKPQHWWYLPTDVSREIMARAGYADRADLPRIATRLSGPTRRAMLQAFMLAEGDDRDNFYNGDPAVIEAFQILCALEGYATSEPHQHLTVKRMRRLTTRHIAGSNLRRQDAGRTAVWCPTTRFGTWVMRQNGRVMITGNTKAKRRVTLSICGLGWLDETEIGGIPDARPIAVDRDTGEIIDQPTSAPPPRQNGHKPPVKPTESPQSDERPLIGPAQNIEARYNDKGQLAVRFTLNDQVVIYANAPAELTYMENGDPVVVSGKPDTIKGQKAIRAVDVVPDFEPDLWIERAKQAQAKAQTDIDDLFPEKPPDAPQNGRRGGVVVEDLPL